MASTRTPMVVHPVRLPAAMLAALRKRAAAEDRNVSWLVRAAVSSFLSPTVTAR